jgi:S1-C subfamily serine protease
VITAFDGARITDSEDLVAAIAEHEPGDAVKVEVRRGSQSLSLEVTLQAQPAESASAEPAETQPAEPEFAP